MELKDLEAYFDPKQPLPKGQELSPGVLAGVKEEDYRSFKAVNASLLKLHTLAEVWHEMTKPPADKWGTDSEAEKWTNGILAHWAVLERERFDDFNQHVIISPTKGLASQRCQSLRLHYPDKLLVTPENVVLANKCLQAVKAHDKAFHLMLSPGKNEVSLFHFDTELGIWRKGRFDRLPESGNAIIDVKTTSAKLQQFRSEVLKFGYHIQGIWYFDLLEALTGERRNKFLWLALTKDEPFMCRILTMDNFRPGTSLFDGTNGRLPLCNYARTAIETRYGAIYAALNETIRNVRNGIKLCPATIRRTWQGYESEDEQPID